MKRFLLVLLPLLFMVSAFAQNISNNKNLIQPDNAVPVNYVEPFDQFTPEQERSVMVPPAIYTGRENRGLIGEVIGHTSYDLQSNSADPQRLVITQNGELAATWTGSTNLNSGSGWPDRGTFYNYYNGTTWNAEPTIRIENVRTGWPTNLITASGKEVIICHDFAQYYLIKLERPVAGTGAWNQTTNLFTGPWARVTVGGANGETIHLLNTFFTNNGENQYTKYFRSQDGGTTWDITYGKLPGIDTISGYNRMGADAYNITARGDVIAIVAGSSLNPVAVWKSLDNGTTWTRTEALSHPIPNMDGFVITDIDNDGVADIIDVHDGSNTILIDTSGMVHVWTGFMRLLDDDPSAGGFSFFPATNGLLYWNETMGTDSMQIIAYAIDINGDSVINIGVNVPNYNGIGISSHPTVAMDENTGRIFLVYSAVVENTDFFNDPSNPDAQSFRDLYGMYTTDFGQTWSDMVNLTRAAKGWYENVWCTAAETADGKVHVMWQRDQEPGHSLEAIPDPVANNEIVYIDFDYTDFDPKAPIADWDHTLILGTTIQFNDSSEFADIWLWDFDDGFISTDQEPLHTFASGGAYNVCLTVTNSVGSDTLCKSTLAFGIDELSLASQINSYPNPSSSYIMFEFSQGMSGVFNVQLVSIFGGVERDFNLNSDSQKSFYLDIADLSSGMYILKITSSSQVYTQKINVIR